MSKGLEELEKLGNEYPSEGDTLWSQYSERFSIIEKELKDYEYWSSFVKCYGDVKAEDLQRFIHNGWVYDQTGYKKDKALKIIKDKAVSMAIFIQSTNVEEYNYCKNLLAFDLTQEEYDFLKEVLL